MPQVEQVRSKSRVNPQIIAGIALGVIVLVVVGFLLLKPSAKDTTKDTSATLNKAADRAFTGDKDGAIADLKAQLSKASTDAEKASLYVSIAGNYEAKDDYKNALENYRAADKLMPGYGPNEAVARVAVLSGDKALAVEYLKKNRELIKNGSAHQHRDDLSDIEKQITDLGGKL